MEPTPLTVPATCPRVLVTALMDEVVPPLTLVPCTLVVPPLQRSPVPVPTPPSLKVRLVPTARSTFPESAETLASNFPTCLSPLLSPPALTARWQLKPCPPLPPAWNMWLTLLTTPPTPAMVGARDVPVRISPFIVLLKVTIRPAFREVLMPTEQPIRQPRLRVTATGIVPKEQLPCKGGDHEMKVVVNWKSMVVG